MTELTLRPRPYAYMPALVVLEDNTGYLILEDSSGRVLQELGNTGESLPLRARAVAMGLDVRRTNLVIPFLPDDE